MKFFIFCSLQFCLLCLGYSFCFAQPNICIDSGNAFGPEEVSLTLCRSGLNKIVAGANITRFYNSSDTGRTWSRGIMKSPYGVWGDPCVVSDTAGNFYFIHLSTPANGSWLDRIVCQKSTDGGATWNDGSYMGLNGHKNQDKAWAAVDFTQSIYRNRIYLSWTQFDQYKSTKAADSSRILFSYSDDAGTTWQKPIRLDNHGGDCLDGDNTVEGAVPCVGPKGQVYDAWAGSEGIVFTRSLDGGKTWLPRNIKVSPVIGGWDYDITGIDRCNGMPVICCDVSNGQYRGTVYISWSDQRNGKDNTDVWLVKSTDEGNTWSKPVMIDDDESGTQQFMTWLDVDPITGYLYSLFYDRREHRGDTTDVYLAVSTDGGSCFHNFKINDHSFLPSSSDFFGDYINVKAFNNVVRPIWMQLQNDNLSIYTALINPGDLDWVLYKPAGPHSTAGSGEEASNNESIWFTVDIEQLQNISLSVVDVWGNKVYEVFTNRKWKQGQHEYLLNIKKAHIAPGVYAYKLDMAAGSIYKSVLIY